MKKILIITRSFPPSNKTASYRALSFARYFSKYGYYPIIVTRHWDNAMTHEKDIQLASGSETIHEMKDGYEVYYIPFKGTFSKRFNLQSKVLKKIALLIEIYFGKLDFFNPHYSLYKFATMYLRRNSVDKIIVSVPPFDLLKYGNRLSKKHGVKWVADYRDEWTSEGSLIQEGKFKNVFSDFLHHLFLSKKMQQKNEINFTSNCIAFTSVSNQAIASIAKLINKSGTLIVNGFDAENHIVDDGLKLYDEFTIAYAGWLYNSQQIEILCEAVKLMADKHQKFKFKLLFIGGKSFEGMPKRLNDLMKGYEYLIEFTDRVSKYESIKMQQKSHLLLLSAHKGKDGIPSSKLYEYIGAQKKVLLCPSDNGVIEETLKKTNQALICNSVSETFMTLNKLYELFLDSNSDIQTNINKSEVENFSREKQVEKFAHLLDSL